MVLYISKANHAVDLAQNAINTPNEYTNTSRSTPHTDTGACGIECIAGFKCVFQAVSSAVCINIRWMYGCVALE